MNDYWIKQDPAKPAFPDIEWQKPQQKAQAGKLLIIGGNKHGFAAVAQAYSDARKAGVGECRVLLPDVLKSVIDKQAIDCIFADTNPSGGFSKEGLPTMRAGVAWADALLLIGDTGRNSETAIMFETLLRHTTKPVIITRDTIDLLKANTAELVNRPQTIFVATLAQMQKLFQAMYFPKSILFSMQLTTLVEALHKFTISYPATVVTFHQNQLLTAHEGRVSSTPWHDPLLIWRGSVAATIAVYAMQHPGEQFEAITDALRLK